jgi:pimeloyl-ACP methyl ester carboxylesterase
MKITLTSLLLLLTFFCYSQSDFKAQFKTFSIQNKKLGQVEFCTFQSTIDQKKPLMIFIHGSGNLPTFQYIPSNNGYNWSAFTEVQKYKDNYHVIFVNKPDVPLFDTVQGENGNFTYPVSEEFNRRYSLEWRAEAASCIIDQAIKLLPTDKSKIVVIGHSQGGQAAPKVALLNKKVTHVVLLNSNSLNHLYDFVLQERLASFQGEQSFDQSQQNIDSLFAEYRRFFNDPYNTTTMWNGGTYYRWASFSDETPLENMLKLKIPVFVVAGGKDLWGSFIMNTDYVQIEFLRHKRNNLVYKVYPNANHFLQDEIVENGRTQYVDIKPEVFREIDKWAGLK